MGAEEEARKKAIGLYRILAIVQLLLGIALLTCGGFGTQYEAGSFGPPFFVGGFIVGSFMVISALLCMCVGYKGSETAGNEVQRREVACGVMGQYILAMFTFMGCFIGLVFAGIGTCDDDDFYYDSDEIVCPPERDAIRYAIIVLVVVAILTNIFSMYIVCTYGSYFGVVMTRGRRGRMVMTINTTANTPVYNTHPVTGTYTSDIGRNDQRMQQLERQNALLQQQLELQRQFAQNPPPYSGGYPPPPQPATYGFNTDPAFPPSTPFPAPDAPPPTYSSLGISK